jgi:hypothetical protein
MDYLTCWSELYYMLLLIIKLWSTMFQSAQESDFDDYSTEHIFSTNNLKNIFLLFFNF